MTDELFFVNVFQQPWNERLLYIIRHKTRITDPDLIKPDHFDPWTK